MQQGWHVTVEGFALATENCENVGLHEDGHCNPCHKLVPWRLKVEFCIGVGGRVCGRKIE
jgi:hypothetical protein